MTIFALQDRSSYTPQLFAFFTTKEKAESYRLAYVAECPEFLSKLTSVVEVQLDPPNPITEEED